MKASTVRRAKRRIFIVCDDFSNHVSVFIPPISKCPLLRVSSSHLNPEPYLHPPLCIRHGDVLVLRALWEAAQRLPRLIEPLVLRRWHTAL